MKKSKKSRPSALILVIIGTTFALIFLFSGGILIFEDVVEEGVEAGEIFSSITNFIELKSKYLNIKKKRN